MERLVLTARVTRESGGYVARVDGLPLEGKGASAREAEDQLIHSMRAWVEAHDGRDSLEQALSTAGFPGLVEETELQLEFVE